MRKSKSLALTIQKNKKLIGHNCENLLKKKVRNGKYLLIIIVTLKRRKYN